MKTTITTALLAGAVITLSACSGSPTPSPPARATLLPAPVVATSATPSATESSQARPLVDALASGTSASMLSASSLVAGPVMTHYVSFQAVQAEAAEASGQPQSPGSVTVVSANSYQTCFPQQGCQSFSDFQSAAGRITGMDVDGQPVAARLAAGPNDRGNGLVLTDVASYLYTSTGQVGIAFHVRNNGNSGVSTDGFLPAFVTSGGARLSPDLSSSTINSDAGPLRSGESEALVVVFDTRIITGTFILQSNGGYQDLVSSRLAKPTS